MKVSITGGSGFVGTHLARDLLMKGHEVTALGSRSAHPTISHDHFTYISADTTQSGAWQEAMTGVDVIFNLAGRTIFNRWSPKYKQQLTDSRILTTRNVVAALPENSRTVLISTSAVGYYGDSGEDKLLESRGPGSDFLAELATQWEAEAQVAEARGARVVLARFGIVLGRNGGAMAKMVPAFKSFVGGPLGKGRQWFPWIHIRDHIEALNFLATQPELSGAFNLCAPHPVRNAEMAKSMGRALGRPSAMAAPAFVLKMTMGEVADVLLASQRALPDRLMAAGFKFQYATVDEALADLV